MGFRFQRRVKVLPGVHANLSKGGVSVSVGPKGLKTTIGKHGIKTSVGIPGTGIRYEMPWGGEGKPPYSKEAPAVYPTGMGTTVRTQMLEKSAMDNESTRLQQTIGECTEKLKALAVFRTLYIVGLAVVLSQVGGAFLGCFFSLLGIAVVIDLCCTLSVKQRKDDAMQRQQIVEAKQRKAREEHEESLRKIQVSAVQAWADRCQKAHGVVTIRSSYPCKRGEGVLHTEEGSRLLETRKVRLPGGITTDQWTHLDTGTLHVTNQRVVFIGGNGNRSVPIKDIIGTKGYVDGFEITSCKRAKPMRFSSGNAALIRTMVATVQEHPEIKLVPEDTLPQEKSEQEEQNAVCGHRVQNVGIAGENTAIPAGYLEMVVDAAEAMGAFVKELDGEITTGELLGQVEGIDAVENLGVFSTKNAKLGFLVYSDMMRTCKGLGYSLETVGEAELVGLGCGFLQVLQFEPAIEEQDWIKDEVRQQFRNDLVSLAQVIETSVQLALPDDQFLFPFVFSYSENGQALGQQYLTLLYRWASIVAKADGVISKSESE